MASQLLAYIHNQVTKAQSYVGHKEVGDYLVGKIFKPGARYDWNTLLSNATGETLNPEYFVKQFVS
jgi:Zn-dependent M32 family carboxypeptidase